MNVIDCYAGYRLTYPQAQTWLVNAGIDPSPYHNPEPNMLDRLVDLLEEKIWYPDEILINPFDDPITNEPILFLLTRIVVRNLKRTGLPESDEDLDLKKQLLKSSGFKDDEMPWCSYYRGRVLINFRFSYYLYHFSSFAFDSDLSLLGDIWPMGAAYGHHLCLFLRIHVGAHDYRWSCAAAFVVPRTFMSSLRLYSGQYVLKWACHFVNITSKAPFTQTDRKIVFLIKLLHESLQILNIYLLVSISFDLY